MHERVNIQSELQCNSLDQRLRFFYLSKKILKTIFPFPSIISRKTGVNISMSQYFNLRKKYKEILNLG